MVLGNKKKCYDYLFKRNIVQDYMNGESVSYLQRKYEVSKTSIYYWTKSFPIAEGVDSLSGYAEELEKENRGLKQQVRIIKRAMTLLLKE